MTDMASGSTSLTAKVCGCRMEPVTDDETMPCDLCSEATEGPPGRGWVIVYCPRLGAAPALLAALRDICSPESLDGDGVYLAGAIDRARHAIDMATKGDASAAG